MIERWCSWHNPVPVLLKRTDDGRAEIIKTHGICPECVERVERLCEELRQVEEPQPVASTEE